MKLKLKNISNKNDYKGNNYFISEEINESVEASNDNEYNANYIQSNPNNIKLTKELNNILLSDYNEISDAEYRELLSKKEQYLEANLRLEKNITEVKKTKSKKMSHIFSVMKENEKNLENLKLHNNLIEKEINNLCKVFQLTVEQAKLQNELNQKNGKIKKISKKESVKNEENKLIKSSDKIPQKRNFDDISIPNKKVIKSIEVKNKKKNKKETRDEQLKMIKEKYRDENNFLSENDSHMKEVRKENNKEEYKSNRSEDELINKNNDKEEQNLNNEKIHDDINNEKINNMELEEKNEEKEDEDNYELEPL